MCVGAESSSRHKLAILLRIPLVVSVGVAGVGSADVSVLPMIASLD
jgi:hypothetical protein